MAQTITKYKIFLASPSDLQDERESITEVINELNVTYAAPRGIYLELLKWETHSAPGVSFISSQDIINRDLGNTYDLFIGMLWTHFGTPTSTSESGTGEEFMQAYKRFREYKENLQILFYFKNSSKSLDQIDAIQLQKVRDFKTSLGDKDLLWWEFDTEKNLQSFLRLHIPMRIEQLMKTETNVFKDTKELISMNDFEELGILDYQDKSELGFEISRVAMTRISDSITWVGEKIVEKNLELDKMKAKKPNLAGKELRKYLQSTAAILNDFASRIEPEIPIFSRGFEEGITSISQILNLTFNDEDDAIVAYNATCQLLEEMFEAINSIDSFLNSISLLPRLEKELNRARNNVELKISNLISELHVNYSIGQELKKQFETKYDLDN